MYNIEDSVIIAAIKNNNSLLRVLRSLGFSGTQPQYEWIRNYIADNTIDVSHFRSNDGASGKHVKEKLKKVDQKIVNECDCFKDIAVKVGICNKTDILRTKFYSFIKDYVKDASIDVSHFTYSKGGNPSIRYSDAEVFKELSDVSKQTVKARFLVYRDTKNIKYECDICGVSEWLDKPINLQMDHVNGINNDNRINNLRMLCPNCHSQTDTFGGRKNKLG